MDINVQHNEQDQVFYVEIPDGEAELAYSLPVKDVIDFQHTYVSENVRNQGIAEQLVITGLEYARSKGFKVIPTCHFVASYVKRHMDTYKDILVR